MIESSEIPDFERRVKEDLVALLGAPSMPVKREIIRANPGLLTDAALRLLEEWAASQDREESRKVRLVHRDLLLRCKEIGIEATFSEILQTILAELAGPARLDEMPRRAELCQRALDLIERERNPELWAALQGGLADSLLESPSGGRAENVERAIAGYGAVLQVWTRQAMPVQWAMTQMNLATAYRSRIRGERGENVERAIAGYEAALNVRTRHAMPVQWAMTQMNLAIAYAQRICGERAQSLERAIAGFEAALEVQTQQTMPVEWATTQMNLATAYQDRIRGERAENLERAIAGFEAALQVLTRTAMPVQWAITQMNLAITCQKRIQGERAQSVERAVAGYEAALQVLTRDAMPVEWATTQMNLGTAYQERIRGERAENLERAIAGYEAALQVRTRSSMPVEWATAQINMANAYWQRIRGEKAENLERAIAGYEAALLVLTREVMPVKHLQAQLSLGRLLFENKRWKQACSALFQAMVTQEFLYQTAATPEARQATLREFSDIHPWLAYALAQAGDKDNLAEAIVVAERGRARAMAERLALDEAPLDAVRAEDRRSFEDVRKRIELLQAEARLAQCAPGRHDFLTLSSELRQSYADLQKLIGRIREYVPEFLPETSFEDIRKAAAKCPLVYLITTMAGGVGLLVGAGGDVEALLAARLVSGRGAAAIGYLPGRLF